MEVTTSQLKTKDMSTTSNFSITTQSQFDEALMWVSDLFKDVNGFRPRGYNFHNWSFQELTDFINDLSDVAEKQEADEREWAKKAVDSVMSVGADCKETALRWLDQADAYFMYGDDEFYEDHIEKYGWVAKRFELS
tara:strand:+ start:742 stop:1149 length:408 start_codon:yes stop_codon:yes gene_type:complete